MAPISARTKATLLQEADAGRIYCEQILENTAGAQHSAGVGATIGKGILNALEFTALFIHDSNVLLIDLVQSDTALRANLYSRQIILTGYESLLQLKNLLAKGFQAQAVAALGPGVQAQVRGAHSTVTHLFEKWRQNFGDIRHGLAGHREGDREARRQLLASIDYERVAAHLGEVQGALIPVLTLFVDLTQRLVPEEGQSDPGSPPKP
jgi:hypothetical protein